MLTYKQIEELDADALFEIERQGVGPGWQALIEKCHTALRESSPKYKPIQIKEKFGSLRFYVQGVDFGTPAYEPITEAEAASETTCEECGQLGEVKAVKLETENHGWLRCLSPEDFDKAVERRRAFWAEQNKED